MRAGTAVGCTGLLLLLSCADKGDEGGNLDKPGLFEDKDGDGDGYVYGEDCNDANESISPGAQETCDPADVDEDCDGLADNADDDASGAVTTYHDADGDGYGDAQAARLLCEVVAGYVTDSGDCDDNDARISPVGVEICDPLDVDEDCDGRADDADDDATGAVTYYEDLDGDGFGDDGETITSCDPSGAFVEEGGDCDDDDPTANPDAAEVWYDGDDGDCSGGSDYDQDGDGYDATVAEGGRDCDDTSADAHPGGSESWYDGVDGDCSGGSDFDRDGDGHESDDYGGDDCDDTDEAYYPGAWETGTYDYDCDGVARPTPQAIAEASGTLETCTNITLDGSDSRDPRSLALTYAWELVDLPETATETTDDIVEPDDVTPTFLARTPGDYVFQLVVTNALSVESAPDLVSVTIVERDSNTAPVASAGADQSSSTTITCDVSGYTELCDDCAPVAFTLDATGSTDADDEPLTYAWSVSSGTATLSDTEGDTVTVTLPAVTADYGRDTTSTVVVRVVATDCYGDSATDTVTLTSTCTGE